MGYSCVLFALVVVSTSKTREYCPLPGLKRVCLPTWQLPVPFLADTTLPFNAAPFLLLVAMHYLVPRASFVGHLSGIVMGYPLVWGGLNWCSPQALARLCVAAVLFRAWAFAGAGGPGGVASPGRGSSSGGVVSGGGHWSTATTGHVLASPSSPPPPGGDRSRRLLVIVLLMAVVTVARLMASSWYVALM